MSNNIILLTYFYSPDLSAGSFRASALVSSLEKKISQNDKLIIFTTRPNRYKDYNLSAPKKENKGSVIIHRCRVPFNSGNILAQFLNFVYFSFWVLVLSVRYPCNLVYSTSGKLGTAALGSLLSRLKSCYFYVDIRDLFCENISDLDFPLVSRWLISFFNIIENNVINRADTINLNSPGFNDYFVERYGDRDYRNFTNGIDEIFLRNKKNSDQVQNRKPIILYAGNIGAGQALEKLVPTLAKHLSDYDFFIIGAGNRKDALVNSLSVQCIKNVFLHDPVSREEVLDYYSRASFLFLHLDNVPAFEVVIPSKLFEYAATGLPILMGASGWLKDFVDLNVRNAATFQPCNVESALKAFNTLEAKPVDRKSFCTEYSRLEISNNMADDVLNTMRVNKLKSP